jgi:hypothetical protein
MIFLFMALYCREQMSRQLLGAQRTRLPQASAAVHDPYRHFTAVNCRIAKGYWPCSRNLDALVFGDPFPLRSLGQEHGRTIPLAAVDWTAMRTILASKMH